MSLSVFLILRAWNQESNWQKAAINAEEAGAGRRKLRNGT